MVAALLILVLIAVLWPEGFRAALGCLSFLLGVGILWGLMVWAAVAWLDYPLNGGTMTGAAVVLALILWEGFSQSSHPDS